MSIKRWKLGLKRCNCVKCEAAITFEQTEENCGWVMWEDHKDEVARLKAEVEILKGQVNYWKIEAECDHGRWLRCLEDMEKLRASSFVTAVPVEQYERVIKAGDNLVFVVTEHPVAEPFVKAWYAAKEGKGQP